LWYDYRTRKYFDIISFYYLWLPIETQTTINTHSPQEIHYWTREERETQLSAPMGKSLRFFRAKRRRVIDINIDPPTSTYALNKKGFLMVGILGTFGILRILQEAGPLSIFQQSYSASYQYIQSPLAPIASTTAPTLSAAANNTFASSKKSSNFTPTQPPFLAPVEKRERVFSNFLMHIPKSGSTYAMAQLAQMVFKSRNEPKPNTPRPCNEGKKMIRNFKKFRKSYNGNDCNLWMTEQPFTHKAERVYAIIRDPRSHTLSMYFHCHESRRHKRYAYLMPISLDEWLKGWVDAKRKANSSASIEEQRRLNKEWNCYNPINFQTRWIGYNDEKVGFEHSIFYPSISNGTMASAGGQQRQYLVTPKSLRERYIVLGDQSQMDKSICMIHMYYRGFVMEACNCTNVTLDTTDATTTKRLDHGVSHHGDTFQTTPEQDARTSATSLPSRFFKRKRSTMSRSATK